MPLRIAITGSTGLVGTACVNYFSSHGHNITRIVRLESNFVSKDQVVYWDVKTRKIDREALEGHDAIIHLAGANIADERWTEEYKEQIHSSRIHSTVFLAETLAKLEAPPKVFISASAIGYYGNIDDVKRVDESHPPAQDFLAKVCQDWEKATEAASQAGIRTVMMRTGVVLSGKGGALMKMLPIFNLGLGGKLGRGNQVMSWVALDEIPLIINAIITNSNISGPVNVVSPFALSNAEFTKVLGNVLGKPTIFPVPSLAVKVMFGEMGKTLLLEGARVEPRKLTDNGYNFKYSSLENVLRKCVQEAEAA